jgi:hypothetical protein
VAAGKGPTVPADGEIGREGAHFPDAIDYDPATNRLLVGDGHVDRVPPAVWAYEVSGKQVLHQWFSYRKPDRDRPIMDDRRPPSKLGEIQPDQWPVEYATELLNVLHVLARLVALEPAQAELMERICGGPTLTADDLRTGGALDLPAGATGKAKGKRAKPDAASLACSAVTTDQPASDATGHKVRPRPINFPPPARGSENCSASGTSLACRRVGGRGDEERPAAGTANSSSGAAATERLLYAHC